MLKFNSLIILQISKNIVSLKIGSLFPIKIQGSMKE